MAGGLVNPWSMPGMGTATLTTEVEFLWGPDAQWFRMAGVMDSAAVDAGASPTTSLRRGLLLGQVASTGKFKAYNQAATDGTQIAYGVLIDGISMLDYTTGLTADKQCDILVGGPVRGSQVIGLDYAARRQMYGRFVFDDMVQGSPDILIVEAHTASYSVLAGDVNKIFTNEGATGAVTFTLPTLAPGLRYRFHVEANQSVTVAGASGTVVAFNNAAATSVSFSTSGQKIGGSLEVVANADATKWLVRVSIADPSQTVTVA